VVELIRQTTRHSDDSDISELNIYTVMFAPTF